VLAVHTTSEVVPYLVKEFFGEYSFLTQRLDILEVLIDAARRLSSLAVSKTLPPPPKLLPSTKVGLSPARSEIEKPTEEKTRRWGRASTSSTKVTSTETNKKHHQLEHFFSFLGLIYDYIRRHVNNHYEFTLFGPDGILLGKLLYSLGIFLECIGQTMDNRQSVHSLIELVYIFRYHKQAHVRRSAIFATTRVFHALSSEVLLSDEFSRDLMEIHDWLAGVTNDDPDEDCRALARTFLVTLATVLKQQSVQQEQELFTLSPQKTVYFKNS